MKYDYLSFRREVTRTVRCIALLALAAGAATSPASAEDWGAFALIPSSAPTLVLEAVGSGTTDGTVISIGKPAGTPNQKWVITAKGNNFYSVKPSYTSALVLATAKGGTAIGAAIVLETESCKPWQEWNLKKNENGSYCLSPRHAPEKGLDHLGGRPVPGAKIDLWTNNRRRSASGVDHQAARGHHGCGRAGYWRISTQHLRCA